MANTKDFLIKLEPSLGESFQTYCRSEGRSQQSVFSLMVHEFLSGGDSAGDSLIAGLALELIQLGTEYQQKILDEIVESRMIESLRQLQERKAARAK